MGRADPGDSHPIINEWEGFGWFSDSPGVLGHPCATYMSPKFFLLLACLTLLLVYHGFVCAEHIQTLLLAIIPQTMQYNNDLHSIYIVVSIIII
jgi:hypothetical protein